MTETQWPAVAAEFADGPFVQLVAAGMPVAALSPLELARWVGPTTDMQWGAVAAEFADGPIVQLVAAASPATALSPLELARWVGEKVR